MTKALLHANHLKNKIKDSLDRQTTGGLLLILATIIALVITNVGLDEQYYRFLEKEFVVGFMNNFELRLSIKEWVNDGLMVIFFLVAGLEIKREVSVGELSNKRKASMPVFGALGGMLMPALIFFVVNLKSDYLHGWAIPVATDIAYALGILGLLKSKVPLQLKVFLTALAIADDLGAILIIAIFYSSNIAWVQIAFAGIIFIVLILLNRFGVRVMSVYVILGILFWICFIHSGIHPTIAGVLFALTVPVKPKMSTDKFKKRTKENMGDFNETDFETLDPFNKKEQRNVLSSIRKNTAQAYPILLRMEEGLEGFNSYFIIPVFALVNAGVTFDIALGQILMESLGLGIILGLVAGKVLGISLFSFLGQKLGFADLPEGVSWKHIIGMGFIAGIGFTMSLFITNLAFTNDDNIQIAKISILGASLLAGCIGVIFLILLKKKSSKAGD